MTLIVGIKCSDGVVVGADGAATLGSLGNLTIRQPVRKLEIIQGSIVMGTSGPVGLGQILRAEIDEIWMSKRLSNKKPHEAMVIIREAFWKHQERELRIAKVSLECTGSNSAMLEAICFAVVGVPVSKRICLFQFSHQGSPEMATNDLPFIAVGSGQQIADPFLAFLRRIYWSDSAPSVADGILATVWTLRHAIQTTPGGVADPIQIMVLQSDNKGQVQARELTGAELQEHEQYRQTIEDGMKNLILKPTEQNETQSVPASPTPP